MSETSVTVAFLLSALFFIIGFIFGTFTSYIRTSVLRKKLKYNKEELYSLKKIRQKNQPHISSSETDTKQDSFAFELLATQKENQLVELRKEVEELRAKFANKEADFQVIAAQTAGLAPLSNRLHESNAKMGLMESDLRELDLARAQVESLMEQLLDAEKQFETNLQHKQTQIESLEKTLKQMES